MRNLTTILMMLFSVNVFSSDVSSFFQYSDSTGECPKQNLSIQLNEQNLGDLNKPVAIALNSGIKHQETIENDPRKVFKGRSDKEENHWMQAVGKVELENFSDSNKGNTCSTSLVTEKRGQDANIIVMAGHCLNDWLKKGQSNKDAEVTFTTLDGKKVKRSFSSKDIVLNKYSSDHDDYAIIKLNQPVSRTEIKPLLVANQRLGDIMLKNPNAELMSAGYHGDIDPKFGNKGKNLTYQKCREAELYISQKFTGTTCVSYQGGSGSPLVVKVDREGPREQEEGNEYLFVGSLIGAGRDKHYITQFASHGQFVYPLINAIRSNKP
tara:strand:- start:146647 stop:147615 length:969 start_codon:yes stop_codon:yes gene_type:complete